ncbi:hypothetical protein FRX31_028048 [Thalictrum thalictroides]|uniref:Uncharacterized protein n=1 Tax=Thalictrum thalictroides TaxID=46969 RepID=A0A7J6VDU3_THATH|nr:hypothetical protein FRX31_028048 [Thalictrum thalictroides]
MHIFVKGGWLAEKSYNSVSLSSNKDNNGVITSTSKRNKERRVFSLAVNPLCYTGTNSSLRSFSYWISLIFSQVSHTDPVIADFEGKVGMNTGENCYLQIKHTGGNT